MSSDGLVDLYTKYFYYIFYQDSVPLNAENGLKSETAVENYGHTRKYPHPREST